MSKNEVKQKKKIEGNGRGKERKKEPNPFKKQIAAKPIK